jgi:hypothetical protein
VIIGSSSGSRPVVDAQRFGLRLSHLTDDRYVAQPHTAWSIRPAATLDHPKDGGASRLLRRGTRQQGRRRNGHFIQPHEPEEWSHLTLHWCHANCDDVSSWTSPTGNDASRKRSPWLLAARPANCARFMPPQQFFNGCRSSLDLPPRRPVRRKTCADLLQGEFLASHASAASAIPIPNSSSAQAPQSSAVGEPNCPVQMQSGRRNPRTTEPSNLRDEMRP